MIVGGLVINQKMRIQKDIHMFEDNYKLLNQSELSSQQKKIVELAYQYCYDSKYYIDKKDFFTAFGCINYAHGLLDSIVKF